MIGIIILLSIVFAIWIIGFFLSNDLNVTSGSFEKYKKILIVYPHPDDETLAQGGVTRNFFDEKKDITLVTLTQGERGTDDAHLDASLKQVRTLELTNATMALGISNVFLEDFGDGELANQTPKLREYLEEKIKLIQPDMIMTYDLAGLYGHQDHIVTSEILTELVLKKYKNISLYYASLPKKVLSMITLPEHMAKDSEYANARVFPTMKVFVGFNVLYKIRALYSYKSQLYSFRKSFPIKWIPLWYYYSMQLFEYYHKAN